jgi:hypothetical protein
MGLMEEYKKLSAGEYSPKDFIDYSIWFWDVKGKFTFEITRGDELQIVYPETVLGDASRPSVQERFKRELKSLFRLRGREGEEKARERDLMDFIEGTLPNTFIVYQRTAPGWVRLIVREDGGGRR